jgi:hypothetical protein
VDKNSDMKNVLIFAGLAALAAAVAIYFFGETDGGMDDYYESDYISDVDIENYDLYENTGAPRSV